MDIYDELDKTEQNGSFAFDYAQQKNSFDWQKIDNYSYCQLKRGYNDFMHYLKRINDLSKQYFDAILAKEKKHENKYYFDLSSVYISEIQNIYLNPINNRLNQRKANWSIGVGVLAIIISLVISFWDKIIPLCNN